MHSPKPLTVAVALLTVVAAGPSAAETLCGNGVVDAPEQCDGGDLGGATCAGLGYTLGGTLACAVGCAYDVASCASQAFPGTGQTTCWNGSGTMIDCAGTGQDGELQAGAALAYVDNGDGTITDRNTGLVWEKLSDDGSIHDKDSHYIWSDGFAKVAALNASSFAGHTDWRMPNVKELQSIMTYQGMRAWSPAFYNGCVSGCTVLTCSCSGGGIYWTSSTMVRDPTTAHCVWSLTGAVSGNPKNGGLFTRAVRGPE